MSWALHSAAIGRDHHGRHGLRRGRRTNRGGTKPVGAYLAKRLGYYAVLLVVAVFLSYVLASLALDPRAYFEGRQPPISPSAVDHHLTAIGINDHTAAARAVRHTGRTARSTATSAGPSTTRSVNAEFGRRVGVSLRLLLIGTAAGHRARRAGRGLERGPAVPAVRPGRDAGLVRPAVDPGLPAGRPAQDRRDLVQPGHRAPTSSSSPARRPPA